MTYFTQSNFLKKGLFALLLLCCWGLSPALQAQNDYTMTVTAPAGIAGDYEAVLGGFGTFFRPCSFSGELILVEDSADTTLACTEIVNDLTGKIAVIDRGDCEFGQKILNAENQGAIGVIVVTNTLEDLFIMGPGAVGDQVTIPSWMITMADGDLIKQEIENGIMVSFAQDTPEFPTGEVVVWGDQPGEGDFDGGLNDWTAETISCNGVSSDADVFTWNATGTAPNGSCSAGEILSPTRCNGAIVVESDFIDSNGDGCGDTAVGTGPCPAPQIAELTSPEITLDGSSTADLTVRFYQHLREFGTEYRLAWTTDGGMSYDTVQFNQDVEIDEDDFSPVSDIVRIALPGTAGATSLQFKFIVNANYYFWIIDDVQIVEQPANDVAVDPFFAVPPNAATPLPFVESFGFLADIRNAGGAEQTGVNLNVTIIDLEGNIVFSADNAYGDVTSGNVIENIPFEETFTPTQPGTYLGRYAITSDNVDAIAENDTQDFTFVVTDDATGNIFAKELSGPTNATLPVDENWEGTNEPHAWAWGNCYYVPQGNGYFVQDISFGMAILDDGAVGQPITVFLYEWDDINNDNFADPEERTFVGFAPYTITGNEVFDDLITLPITSIEGGGVLLQDDTYYLAMVEYTPSDQSNIFISFNEEIEYDAMQLVSDSLGMRRYADMLGINGDLQVEPYSPFGFTDNPVPVVRMTVTPNDPTTSTEELQVLQSQFEIAPNPVADVLNLQLNLEEVAQTATIRMLDMTGKLLNQWQFDNVQQDRYQFRVNNLASGTYFLQVITDAGAGTKKFVVK